MSSPYIFSGVVLLLLGLVLGVLVSPGRAMKFHYRCDTGGKMQNLKVTVTVQWDPAQFAVLKDFLTDQKEIPQVTEQLRASEKQLDDAVAAGSKV